MIARDQILEALSQVIDPELGINIVDLGLVYDAIIKDSRVELVMTMTTPACPLHSLIKEQAAAAIRQSFLGISSVEVKLVWEPPWRPDMMSDAARALLGWRV